MGSLLMTERLNFMVNMTSICEDRVESHRRLSKVGENNRT